MHSLEFALIYYTDAISNLEVNRWVQWTLVLMFSVTLQLHLFEFCVVFEQINYISALLFSLCFNKEGKKKGLPCFTR